VAQRRRLAQETGRLKDTLFRVHIYADDPIFIVIGVLPFSPILFKFSLM
jgi:hypothetical protein